jgi:hypothetical protein
MFTIAAALLSIVLLYGLYNIPEDSITSISTGSISTTSLTTTQGGTGSHLRTGSKDDEKQCTVWMAPSSLLGNPGYGLFTTRDMAQWETVLGGPDGVSIPIESYNQRRGSETENLHKDEWIAVWDNYWWGRGVPDHVNYFAGSDIVDYQIAFGALPNSKSFISFYLIVMPPCIYLSPCLPVSDQLAPLPHFLGHCMLDSLHSQYPKPPYDDSLVSRSQGDPGVGAFSYSMGREFAVTREMKAGEELFLNYGYCKHRVDGGDTPDWTDHIFVPSDFKKAADIIWDHINLHDNSSSSGSEAVSLEGKNTDKLVAKLLPKTQAEVTEIQSKVKSKKDLPMYLAQTAGLSPHTPDWIRSHGMCMEHMVPRKSMLQQAGQGGVAQHRIRKGEMVVPAPLLQIMDKNVLALYDHHKRRKGTQLLLNYCFGHAESSMLLCPDTNAVLINHCSKRTKECGPAGPNADYQWSIGWDPTSDAWRTRSLDDIAKEPGRGLAFEIIALRDIAPGEEVFMDYGVEWERAWASHVTNWSPPATDDSFVTAKKANENGGRILAELVSGDPRKVVDHPYLFTGCQYWSSSADSDRAYSHEYPEWHKVPEWHRLTDEEILERFSRSGKEYKYSYETGYTDHADTSHWPCSVIGVEDDGSYVVRIHQNMFEHEQPWETNNVPRLLYGFSRKAIHYFVKPYASDQHLPGVFRHPIGLRDEIFPPHWKDLAKKKL